MDTITIKEMADNTDDKICDSLAICIYIVLCPILCPIITFITRNDPKENELPPSAQPSA